MFMMKNILFTSLLITALYSCGKRSSQVGTSATSDTAQTTNTKVIWTEQNEYGDERIRAVNENNAGFSTGKLRHVKVEEFCLGSRNPETLDMLPTAQTINKKDSTLIKQLNTGEVFMLQKGERGDVLIDAGTKIQVRFQVGELWIWKSNVLTSAETLR